MHKKKPDFSLPRRTKMRLRTMKALLPTLRERKRYLVFEVVADNPVGWTAVRDEIRKSVLRQVGEQGYARAGLRFLGRDWNSSLARGVVRVSHTSVDVLRSSLGFVRTIGGKPAVIRSVGVSGNLKQARARYLEADSEKSPTKKREKEE